MTTGYPFHSATFDHPATHGQAATSAAPYRRGSWPVNCTVDAISGSSNVVTFTVKGT